MSTEMQTVQTDHINFKDIDKGKAKFEQKADNGWMAMVQHYFVSAWIPQEKLQREYYVRKLDGGANAAVAAGLIVPLQEIVPGSKAGHAMSLYAGPQIQSILEQLSKPSTEGGIGAQGLGLLALHLAALAEKIAQQRRALRRQHPALHLGVEVQSRMGKHIQHRTCCTGLGLGRTKHHPRQPGMEHGASAHHTGLQGDVEGAALQAVVAQLLRSRTQCLHLGVGRGVAAGQRRIGTLAYHLALAHHHSAYGHFASLRTGTRLGQGQAHPVCVFFWGGLVGHDARPSIVTQRVHHIQGVDHASLAPQGEVAREVVEDVERAQGARKAVFVGDVHG